MIPAVRVLESQEEKGTVCLVGTAIRTSFVKGKHFRVFVPWGQTLLSVPCTWESVPLWNPGSAAQLRAEQRKAFLLLLPGASAGGTAG